VFHIFIEFTFVDQIQRFILNHYKENLNQRLGYVFISRFYSKLLDTHKGDTFPKLNYTTFNARETMSWKLFFFFRKIKAIYFNYQPSDFSWLNFSRWMENVVYSCYTYLYVRVIWCYITPWAHFQWSNRTS
jgi:hypothetical protein